MINATTCTREHSIFSISVNLGCEVCDDADADDNDEEDDEDDDAPAEDEDKDPC